MQRRHSESRAPFEPLSTPRLALVALSLDDVPAIFACGSHPEISSGAAWPQHESMADSRRFVARSMVGYARGGHYEWGLKRCTDGALMGTCGFGEIDFARCVGDINYVLAKPYWGQGYATEAAAAVIQFGFIRLGLEVIEALAFPDNTASLRVLRKVGMRYCETSRNGQHSSAPRPVSVWQIERGRWLASRHP